MGDVRGWRLLCIVLAIGLAACTGAAGQAVSEPSAVPTEVMTVRPGPSSEPAGPRDRIVAAYREYTAVAGDALARGVVDRRAQEVASGQALRDLRARVRANRRQGVMTSGELTPSVTADDVAWDGVGSAEVVDCVLNGLAHVDADDPGQVEAEATGTRRPVEASLDQVDGAWVVTRVEMPQDEDARNPQDDPPFLRGPMPDGPPSCAPPDIEREVLAGYRAFWDAFDRAFGFGRDGPANPDDPALAATSIDPQLSETRSAFQALRQENQTSRGERDGHDPWLLAVTKFDAEAVVADCVSLAESDTVDLDTGEIVGSNHAGQLNYNETQMTVDQGVWKVADWELRAEGVRNCESP